MKPVSHFKVTQAGLIALVTTIIGQVVAFVPALSSDKQILISAASAVISAAFLIANAIHAVVSSKVTAADLEGDVVALVKSEVGKVDVNALVAAALKGQNIEQLVRDSIARVFATAATPALADAPLAPAQPTPPPPAV